MPDQPIAVLQAQLALQRRALSAMTRLQAPVAAAGVYVLVTMAGVCEYVGQSKNVLRRIGEHRLVSFDLAKMVCEESLEERLALEATLIAALQPRLNRQRPEVPALA